MAWRVIDSRSVLKSRVFQVRHDQVEMPGGEVVGRDVIIHPGAVVVLGLNPDGLIPFVRQYRHAAGEDLLELVAGTLEPGEDPEEASQRELQEEVGYRAGTITKLAEFYSAPGFCSELLHLYLATDLTPSRLPGDEDERIEVELLSVDEALEMARAGKLRDAKTLAGVLLYAAAHRLR